MGRGISKDFQILKYDKSPSLDSIDEELIKKDGNKIKHKIH